MSSYYFYYSNSSLAPHHIYKIFFYWFIFILIIYQSPSTFIQWNYIAQEYLGRDLSRREDTSNLTLNKVIWIALYARSSNYAPHTKLNLWPVFFAACELRMVFTYVTAWRKMKRKLLFLFHVKII